MKYTFQKFTDSWSFANPTGDDVEFASSLKEIRIIFDEWTEEVARYSEEPAFLVVWLGEHEDVTGTYPDFRLVKGPRGGMIKEIV